MTPPRQSELIHLLVDRITTGTLTQSSLSEATGVHQSQISRILSGNTRRASKNVLKVCKYAETLSPGDDGRKDFNDEILAAVAELRGKSRAENQALAKLMSSLNHWRKTWDAGR
jgi:transcriptional regulator with XRE-family HTH domain